MRKYIFFYFSLLIFANCNINIPKGTLTGFTEFIQFNIELCSDLVDSSLSYYKNSKNNWPLSQSELIAFVNKNGIQKKLDKYSYIICKPAGLNKFELFFEINSYDMNYRNEKIFVEKAKGFITIFKRKQSEDTFSNNVTILIQNLNLNNKANLFKMMKSNPEYLIEIRDYGNKPMISFKTLYKDRNRIF